MLLKASPDPFARHFTFDPNIFFVRIFPWCEMFDVKP